MKHLTLPLTLLLAWTATLPAMAQPAGGPPPGMGMPGMGPMGPTEVGVLTMAPEAAPISTILLGRVTASATAEVRPQVGGVVTEVLVREGQRINAGNPIAMVDPATYEADVAVAEASVASAEAKLPTTQAKVERYETLVASGGISQAELDTAKVDLAQAKAALAGAQAQLKVANLTLDRSIITAPISGIVGALNVQVGSLLTANQADGLTIIRQVDPVDITLVESSSNLLTSRQAMGTAPAKGAPTPAATTVRLKLEDGSSYDQEGSIASMDMVVSETTGTFTLRASVPNPEQVLLPGMFVRATIKFGDEDGVYLVPQRAVTFNADGNPTAYFVGADNKVEQRQITGDRVINNAWVVTAGISPGDQLIVDGLQKIRTGAEVRPLAVTMEASGVIYQDTPKPTPEMPAGGPPPRGMPTGGPPAGFTPPPAGAPADAAPAGAPGGQPAAEGSN